MTDIIAISERRYTTKHYDKSKQVTPKQLQELLTVLRNAPSSVNSQSWHFLVVNNQTAQEQILPAIPDFNRSRITDSSYSIIFCVKTDYSDAFFKHVLDVENKDGRFPTEDIKVGQDKGRRYFVGLHNTSPEALIHWESNQLYIALGQFLFAAAAIGIDSTAIEGFDSAKIDDIYQLPKKGLKSVVMATIGYRASDDGNASRPKSRLPENEIFTYIE